MAAPIPDPTDAAACCAAFYEQEGVRALLGDAFHPGGEALTRRVIEDLDLQPGDRVLDLACGIGTTALLLAEAWDVEVIGVDVSTKNLDRATERAAERSIRTAAFLPGRADDLPLADDQFDAVIVECAVSTFADKPTAAAEIARVLKPGGRLAISDMAVYGALPADLEAFGHGWACVDDALTVEGYRELFASAGLTPRRTHDESSSLLDLIVQLKKKLLLASLGQLDLSDRGSPPRPFGWADADLPTLRGLLTQAKAVVNEGRVRYARLSFDLGEPRPPGPSARRTPACDPSTGCC